MSTQALFGQLLIGLINGSFYALLSLGLAVIFGLLNIINFTHGAQYMMGAFCAYFLLNKLGLGYWWALAITPIAVRDQTFPGTYFPRLDRNQIRAASMNGTCESQASSIRRHPSMRSA